MLSPCSFFWDVVKTVHLPNHGPSHLRNVGDKFLDKFEGRHYHRENGGGPWDGTQ